MKKYLPYALAILGAVMTVVFMRMGRPGVSSIGASGPAAEGPADQLPPAPTADGGYAHVNSERLKALADSNYKGPSYREDYSAPEVMMAVKMRATGRQPASNPSTSKPTDKAGEGSPEQGL